MTARTATDALIERRCEFARKRRLVELADGPTLTADLTWPDFWAQVNGALQACGYARSTRLQYRHILRALRDAGIHRPAELTAKDIHDFVCTIAEQGMSWGWLALHISTLRTIFDRLCGLCLTERLTTPRRGERLPEILSKGEAVRLVQAGETIRDQLLLGLLYGCGLTGREACTLRWSNVLENGARLRIAETTRYRERVLPVPEPFVRLLRTGASTCEPGDHIFRGRRPNTALSTRMVEQIVKKACARAAIERPVCVMTLRHSYATHRIEDGANLRQVQEELGHCSVRTTERYTRCVPPQLESHPFSELRRRMRKYGKARAGGSPANPETPFAEDIPCARDDNVGTPDAPRPLSTPDVGHASRLSELEPIDIAAVQLPFESSHANRAVEFMRALTNRVIRGILVRRRSRSP